MSYGPVIMTSPVGTGANATAWIVLYRAVGEDELHVGVLKRSTVDDNQRFERRAALALKIDHPNIAATLATLEIQGEMHILEEYVHGSDVAHLERKDISPTAAAYIAEQLANALEALDVLKFVHRDIAPENVRISCDGDVKLLDLGFATSPQYRDSKLTAPGFAYAREAYAAPELRQGATASTQTDLYAVGVMLWDLLAQKKRHSEMPPHTRPSVVNPTIPSALDEIVLKAVHPSPAGRYATATDFRRDLRRWLRTQPADGKKALVDSMARFLFMSKLAFDSFERAIESARQFAVAHPPSVLEVRAIKSSGQPLASTPDEAPADAVTDVIQRPLPITGVHRHAVVGVAVGLLALCGGVLGIRYALHDGLSSDGPRREGDVPRPAGSPARLAAEPAPVPLPLPPVVVTKPAVMEPARKILPPSTPPKRHVSSVKPVVPVKPQEAGEGGKSAAEYADITTAQISAGRRDEALRTVTEGLRHWPSDQRLQSLLTRLR